MTVPTRRPPWRTAVAVALLVVATACGSGPPVSPPAGVDGLEIPTPSADPADFVDRIDNPWLPLEPGTSWVYRAEGEDPATTTVTVTDRTEVVQGVTTTVVRSVVTDSSGEVVEETDDWYAQDTGGNVWLFGSSGSWRAGEEGARAGVVVLARPRVGDGYQRELAAGEAEDRAEVLSVDESLNLDAGSWSPVLLVEVTTPLDPGLVEHVHYARGVGPVLVEAVTGGSASLELVEVTRP